MKKLKIVVAGSRDFDIYDYQRVMKPYLDHVMELVRKENKVPIIVSGEAPGADKHGEFYARQNGIEIDPHPADWDNLGKKAGHIRNEEMAKVADLGLIF